MGKYRIFKNKRTKYHPSIFISITVGEKWKNIEITSSPTKTGKYEKLSKILIQILQIKTLGLESI